MTVVNPNLNRALVDKNGLVTGQSEWVAFFSQFSTPAEVVVPVSPTASPFPYIVKEPGSIAVHGGTITSITFNRGSVAIDVTGQKLIPVETKDIVTIVYTVLPVVQFVPRY
jgi:hypothetical protein